MSNNHRFTEPRQFVPPGAIRDLIGQPEHGSSNAIDRAAAERKLREYRAKTYQPQKELHQ